MRPEGEPPPVRELPQVLQNADPALLGVLQEEQMVGERAMVPTPLTAKLTAAYMYQREKKLHSRVADAPQKARSSQSREATWTLPNSPPLSFTTALNPTGGVIEEPTAAPAEMRSVPANLESNALHHWTHAALCRATRSDHCPTLPARAAP